MESRSETHPLIHSIYEETWRSRTRKRCLRMPSQLTITGAIIGLFLVVVTLLIVFENVENGKEDGTDVATKLLASPFKFNKKIEDQSWQDKKDFMKKQKDYKWDKVNKGWKQYPDMPEMEEPSMAEANQASMGKYVPPSIQKLNEDKIYIKNLLHSGTDFKLLDEGWKALTDQGWKDSQIRAAIFQALREKRKELMKEEGILQSPLNLNDIWSEVKDTFEKTIGEGKNQIEYQKKKGEKEMKRQKTLNDEWKDKMNILQSPKSDMKNFVKEDEGWQKLSDSGWKNKMIEEALIQAWKERDNDDEDKETLMQSPMNIQSLFGKATEILKSLVQKGMNYPVSQMEMNDAWANQFGDTLQMSYKKWKENGKNKKKKTKKGKEWKNKKSNNTEVENDTEEPIDTENENEQPMQSPLNFEDIMEIIEIIKEHQKDDTEVENHKKINDEWKKKGKDESERQKGINEKWKKKMKDKESKNQKDINDQWKNKMTNSEESEEQEEVNNGGKKQMNILKTAKLPDKKWKKVDDHWKTLIEHGWTDQELKDAVAKAWKEGDKLLESAMGYNSMKFKKVNDGYKKISKS